jgi:hypothetical protein
MRNIILITGILLLWSSVATAQVPNFVTTIELAGLNIGDSKLVCVEKLGGQYPFNVLSSDFNGCEVYHYMYKKPRHKHKLSDMSRVSLNGPTRMYNSPSDAYLIFKNGLLDLVVTDMGWEDAMKLVDDLEVVRAACREEGLRGCTDNLALNFEEGAVIDDGSCEYPPCGYELNPDFNPKKPVSECNSRFISIKDSDSETVVVDELVNQCSDCDLIEKLVEGNANINVTLKMNSNGRVQVNSPKKEEAPAKTKSK